MKKDNPAYKPLEKKYFANKEKLAKLLDEVTLNKWKILTEAYKQGKKLWGPAFNKYRLARDMDMPYTTVHRCLSLDRVNHRSWKLYKDGKISAFKLAMIAALKNRFLQDEVVDLVISKKLSTYEIKGLNPTSAKDLNEYRHKVAVDRGYARQDVAMLNFVGWIDRGHRFLEMDKELMGETNLKRITPLLKDLNTKLSEYLNGSL